MTGAPTGRGRIGVVLAGGGTGGHIHPNLAIAEALERLAPGVTRVVFVVSDREIDRRVLEHETFTGEPIERVVSPARPLAFGPRGATGFVRHWGGGVRAGREAVRRLRQTCDRVVMLATGGFVSAPAVVGARAEGIERIVVNLDAVPGKANRLAARFASDVLSVGVDLAPIVRDRMRSLASEADARAELGLDPEMRTLLVTGGSQGARSVNRFVIGVMRTFDDRTRWQVIHQTGVNEDDDCLRAWAGLGVRAQVMPYVDRMDLALAACDAVVCRGGAGAVADLWASRRPALILPYPHHRDQHQARNAEPLRAAGGAVVVTDRIDPERNTTEHGGALLSLLDDGQRAAMRQGLGGLGPADGADVLAARILGS